jgi:hypothetical protein
MQFAKVKSDAVGQCGVVEFAKAYVPKITNNFGIHGSWAHPETAPARGEGTTFHVRSVT